MKLAAKDRGVSKRDIYNNMVYTASKSFRQNPHSTFYVTVHWNIPRGIFFAGKDHKKAAYVSPLSGHNMQLFVCL